jgi:Holliday junction resolvase
MNSNQKGKRGEREFANFLTRHGHEARRGQQFSGSPDSPDVVCPSLSQFHIEVKRTEALRLYPSLQQANDDKGTGQMPIVAHRKNGETWVVVMYASDFLQLVEEK